MLKLREITSSDDSFLFALYACTRWDEVKLWGWDDVTIQRFLSMQWIAQNQSYKAHYPNLREKIVLVASDRAGRLVTSLTNHALVLVDISLHPHYRGQGYGSQLIKMLQKEAAETGLSMCLSVVIGNPAKHLYERAGFRVTSSDGVREQMTWQLDDRN